MANEFIVINGHTSDQSQIVPVPANPAYSTFASVFIVLDNGQLLVRYGFETQAQQMPLSDFTDTHHADISFNGHGQIGRVDKADAYLAMRPLTDHRQVEQNANAGNGNVGGREFEDIAAKFQTYPALQMTAVIAATLSHIEIRTNVMLAPRENSRVAGKDYSGLSEGLY